MTNKEFSKAMFGMKAILGGLATFSVLVAIWYVFNNINEIEAFLSHLVNNF